MNGPNDRLSIIGLGQDELRPLQPPNFDLINSAINARLANAANYPDVEHPTNLTTLGTDISTASVLLNSSPHEEVQVASKVIIVIASGQDIYWSTFFGYVQGNIRMNVICPRAVPEDPENHLTLTWFLNKEWRLQFPNNGQLSGSNYHPIKDMINVARFEMDIGNMTIKSMCITPSVGVTVLPPFPDVPTGRVIRPGQHLDLGMRIRIDPIQAPQTGVDLNSAALSPEQAHAFGQLEEELAAIAQRVLTIHLYYSHAHLPENNTVVVSETLVLRRTIGGNHGPPPTPPAQPSSVTTTSPDDSDTETVTSMESGYWSDGREPEALWRTALSATEEEEQQHSRARQIWRSMRQSSQRFPADRTRSAATTQLTLSEPVLQIKAEALRNKRSIGQDTLRSIAKSFLGL
jgi:hypothetical protein